MKQIQSILWRYDINIPKLNVHVYVYNQYKTSKFIVGKKTVNWKYVCDFK